MITWTEFLEKLKGFTWFFDGNSEWIRTIVNGVKTCPVCAASGITGQIYWRVDLDVEGMPQSTLACIADVQESSLKNHTKLRTQLLKACNLA